MALVTPVIDIGLITVAVVIISRFLQSKLIDKKKQKQAQKNMKEKQARIKELMKSQDGKSRDEMERLQKELLLEMNETMQGSMRYMMFSLPLFFGAFFVFGHFYGNQVFEAPFLLPKFDNFFFLNPLTWVPAGWSLETGWLKLYFVTYLIASILLGIAFKVKEKVLKRGVKSNA